MEPIDLIKRYRDYKDNNVAVMVDRSGNLQLINVFLQNVVNCFTFSSYDTNCQETNHLQISIDEKFDNRLYLALISTYYGQFGKGLGTNANTFAEFLFKDKPFKYIYGIFCPGYHENMGVRTHTQKEFDYIARKFYQKNGYEVISKYKFLENPEKYPFLSESDFDDVNFQLKIVGKDINKEKRDFGFKKINGVFVKDNVPVRVVEQIDCMGM